MDSPDGAAGAGGNAPTADASGEMTKLPPDAAAADPGKPLAEGCAASSECASGFCVDGVCCNTACDGQCFNCNQAGTVGYCTAQTTGDDLDAATPCTGSHTCSAPNTTFNVGGCRMKDLQACKTAGDCASLNCETWYVDHDHDGYGDSNTTLKLCEEPGAAAPGGYVNTGGDCCDGDAYAYPGATRYFTSADACGSYDYNCDGIIQGSNGVFAYGEVPVSECGTTVHGSCTSCSATIECH